MTKWEYLRLEVDMKYSEKSGQYEAHRDIYYYGNEAISLPEGEVLPFQIVSHLGRHGWELINVIRSTRDEGRLAIVTTDYYLKRPIEE